VHVSTDNGLTWEPSNNGIPSTSPTNDYPPIFSLTVDPHNPQIIWAGTLNTGHIYKSTDGGHTWQERDNGIGAGIQYDLLSFRGFTVDPRSSDIVYAMGETTIENVDDPQGLRQQVGVVYKTTNGGENWELIWYAGPHSSLTRYMWIDPRNPARVFANNYNGGNFLSEDYGRTWVNASDGYSGAIIFRVEADPFDPARVYGAGRSGIWGSADGGSHWDGLYYPPPGHPVRGIEWTFVAADPSKPGHILGGHAPLLESFDGGESWQLRLQSTSGGSVSVAVFAPSDPRMVYAGVAGDGCIRFHEVIPCDVGGGVLISNDGGTTWQSSTGGELGEVAVYDIAVENSDSNLAYAAADSGLYQTNDGGSTWTRLLVASENERLRSVAIDPVESRHLLAAVDRRGIFTSRDGGRTWQDTSPGLEANNSLHDIVFDPVRQGVVYASDVFSGVYRSENGGATWEKINDGLSNRWGLGLSI